MLLETLGAIFDFLGTVVIGWRSFLGLICGGALAGALAWFRPPRAGDAWALIVIVADSTACRARIPRDAGPVFHGKPGHRSIASQAG